MAVDNLLVSWRQKAANIMLIVVSCMQLPGILLMLLGYGPPITLMLKVLVLIGYSAVVFAAFVRHINYRIRAWLLIFVGYILSISLTIAIPESPHMRALPILLAVTMLVLVGVRSALVATIISAIVIIFVPPLHEVQWLVSLFFIHDSSLAHNSNMQILQIIGLMALLINTMLLLWFFYNALTYTLAAQQHATAALQKESADRATALISLESEMVERKRLEHELARIGDDERRSMGQEVHDGVCQQLTGARLRSQALEQRLARGEVLPAEEVHALSILLEEAINEAHNVAQGLYPLEPEPGALSKALHLLAKRTLSATELDCRFVVAGDTDVPDPVLAQHLYRIAQEAVSNAVRHSGADQITISLQKDDNVLVLQVDDDGTGLNGEKSSGGMGTRTMTYRAQSMSGILSVDNKPSGGVRVICRIPIQPADISFLQVKDMNYEI